MTYTECVNIRQSSKSLIGIEFHQNHWNLFLALVVMFQNSEDCLLHVIHDDVQIYFIFFVSLCVEGVLQSDDIRMEQFFHYLQLSILVSFILVNFLDGHFLICLIDYGLVNNAKRTITYDSLGVVREARWLLFLLLLLLLHSLLFGYLITVREMFK